MTSQEIEMAVTIVVGGLMLAIVSKLSKGRKRGDLRNYFMGGGQIFDVNSISGNVRGLALGLLVCFVGWYLDELGRWIWHQFGNELIISQGKEAWHRIVSTTMGVLLIVSAFFQLILAIRVQRKKIKEDEIEQLRRLHESMEKQQ